MYQHDRPCPTLPNYTPCKAMALDGSKSRRSSEWQSVQHKVLHLQHIHILILLKSIFNKIVNI